MDEDTLKLWNKLSDFVKKICDGRDKSHGHNHMKCVARNALKILENELKSFNQDVIMKIIIVAWLHDVADHKYDKDGTLKIQVREFLKTIFNNENDCDVIMKIIDLISYSNENNAILSGNKIDFCKELGLVNGFIRYVVSDADKLEALGKIGFDRCVEYTRHNYKEKYSIEIPNEILKQLVITHANEKLLRLKDEFIYTNTGKEMAEILHNELMESLNGM